jgi:hypothetical protein
MNPTATIVEVLGRAEQGMTKPFLCRGDDGRIYYVKGRSAGLHSLCCEWIAGHLARAMDLPLPEFAIAEVPTALVEGSDRPDIRELGTGLVFASVGLEAAREITWAEAEACPEELKALVLLFDWWVHNEDRMLSPLGGNPNLLMTTDAAGRNQLWVFDFNLAFDPDFSDERFREHHVFSRLLQKWPFEFRERIEPRLQAAISQLNEWFASLPKEWLHLEGDETLPVHLDQKSVNELLARAFSGSDAFWKCL